MLTATPRHWFTWDYAVSAGTEHLGDIDVSWWRERGMLTLGGQHYEVYRERPLGGDFILESEGTVLARAEKPSALRRRLVIHADGARYELRPRDLFTRTFDLHGESGIMGSLSASGVFSRRVKVDLPDTLPLPLRVFVVWLTVVLWKRDADANGG